MKLATLCYLRREGKTLMMHRVKKSGDMHLGKWNGLGGKFLPGESPEECAQREILEECGLTAEVLTLKGFIVFPMFDGKDDWNVFIFTGEGILGEEIESEEGRLEWIQDEELFDLPLWDGDKIFLQWLKQDKFFSAKFVYENGKLLDYGVSFYG